MLGPALTDADARVHSLDPRTRIIASVVLSVAFSVTQSIAAAGAALFLACVLAAMAPLHLRPLLRRLLPVNIVVALLAASIHLNEWLSPDGAAPGASALLLAFRANAIIIVLALGIGTLDPIHLGLGLRQLRCPAPLALLLLLTTRYIYLFHEEYLRLSEAVRLRAFTPRANRHALRTFGYLCANLLLRAHDRAHRIDDAMRCRGFRGRLPRAAAAPLGAHDWAVIFLAVGAGITVAAAGLP